MLTSSTQLQNRSSHVEDWTRTTTKCTKMKIARGAKHAKAAVFLFSDTQISDVFITAVVVNWELTQGRRQLGSLRNDDGNGNDNATN